MSSRKLLLAGAGVLLVVVAGCGPSEEEVRTAARAEDWAQVQAQHEELDQLRAELSQVRDEIADRLESEGEEEAAEGEQPEVSIEELQTEAEQLQTQVNQKTDAFQERLVSFINEYAGFEDEEPAAEVKEAIRLKSMEDVILAKEYITKGGDYAKAIDIMRSALAVDPENETLQAELARAEELRYMDEERFGRVENGMTEDEVREVLGQVKHQNVREYEDRGVVAWFYPKRAGAAAAVFFRERDGRLRVYDKDFEAVKTAEERAQEE